MTDRPFSIPSSFLPHLPRSQNSFEPLLISDLLAHITVLRSLYIPPVHGGFEVSDCLLDEDEEPARTIKVAKRERRFSAGLAETMDGLGLDLDVSGDASGAVKEELDVAEGSEENEDDDSDDEEEEEESREHLDPFERDWSEKWLNGVVRRAQGWLEEHEDQDGIDLGEWRTMEGILRDASAALAMMAGTSATGSLTRHLLFPLDPSLEPGLKALRPTLLSNPSLSPAAHTFLSSLATSPTSPLTIRRELGTSPNRSTGNGSGSEPSTSPSTSFAGSLGSHYRSPISKKKKRRPAVPVLLHDAPMSDHLSVGVQTWGSAILLGRRMAKYPDQFGLFDTSRRKQGIRMLELGAGTGLLSILCRKLLDLKAASDEINGEMTVPSSPGRARQTSQGLIVATDFLPEVLDNLKLCVDLNFPTPIATGIPASGGLATGINIAKLDWTTFPEFMAKRHCGETSGEEESSQFMNEPFDLVLASDCVYDETHAKMLREVASWVLRLPESGDIGGTFHILSPIRPTFTPELESIDRYFPPHPTTSLGGLGEGRNARIGEGLGKERGLVLGTRGGKRSMIGRRGEGRIDENAGYWWWEVGWA